LLSRLKGLHLGYYEKQFKSKVVSTQKSVKKELRRDSEFLGHIDKFIQSSNSSPPRPPSKPSPFPNHIPKPSS